MSTYLRRWKATGQASEMVLLLACLVLATALRLSFAVGEPFWEGEADSNINALSILERGYPADHYLGIPIYENVLLTTSPGSNEYEFGSASHSARGMVIDHGWIVNAELTVKLSVLKQVVHAHTMAALSGVGQRHSGNYVVSRVVHDIDPYDHVMTVGLVRNGWN